MSAAETDSDEGTARFACAVANGLGDARDSRPARPPSPAALEDETSGEEILDEATLADMAAVPAKGDPAVDSAAADTRVCGASAFFMFTVTS